MRQYTTPEQTAKLIELGFPQPKSEVKVEQAGEYAWYNPAYSIQELKEMLPQKLKIPHTYIKEVYLYEKQIEDAPYPTLWEIGYNAYGLPFIVGLYLEAHGRELIDVYYELILKLKKIDLI